MILQWLIFNEMVVLVVVIDSGSMLVFDLSSGKPRKMMTLNGKFSELFEKRIFFSLCGNLIAIRDSSSFCIAFERDFNKKSRKEKCDSSSLRFLFYCLKAF